MKKKLKTFNVSFNVEVFTSIQISAESIEDAITKARELGVTDVVEIPGEYIDGSLELTGAYE
jgi:hypothetical protein